VTVGGVEGEPAEDAAPEADGPGTGGRLVVVATPIGNLGDLSPRAVDALATAEVVYCEDTRHSRKLLTHAGVSGVPLRSLHGHNEEDRVDEVVAAVAAGRTVALVTDAGMPAVYGLWGALVGGGVWLGGGARFWGGGGGWGGGRSGGPGPLCPARRRYPPVGRRSRADSPDQAGGVSLVRNVKGRSAIRTSTDATSRPSGAMASSRLVGCSRMDSSSWQEPS